MRFIGLLTVGVVAVGVVLGVKTAVDSIPDIKRYIKIRDM